MHIKSVTSSLPSARRINDKGIMHCPTHGNLPVGRCTMTPKPNRAPCIALRMLSSRSTHSHQCVFPGPRNPSHLSHPVIPHDTQILSNLSHLDLSMCLTRPSYLRTIIALVRLALHVYTDTAKIYGARRYPLVWLKSCLPHNPSKRRHNIITRNC